MIKMRFSKKKILKNKHHHPTAYIYSAMVKIVKVDVHVLQAPCEKYVCQASCSF